MRQDTLNFESGLVEMAVNGARTIQFNPSDEGFVDTLFGLVTKLQQINEEKTKELKATTDGAARFDIFRAEEQEMREIVDAAFGEGFCADVFPSVRLFALADGLMVIENFIYALLDKMDEDLTKNIAKREARIAKYTNKYQKKYHK